MCSRHVIIVVNKSAEIFVNMILMIVFANMIDKVGWPFGRIDQSYPLYLVHVYFILFGHVTTCPSRSGVESGKGRLSSNFKYRLLLQ